MRRSSPDTDRGKIQLAFIELRRKGYVCRGNFSCCGSCASYEINEHLKEKGVAEADRKMVYWNRQSDDAFREHGRNGHRDNPKTNDLGSSLYLSWQGDAELIVAELKKQGLNAEHFNDDSRCIEVHPS